MVRRFSERDLGQKIYYKSKLTIVNGVVEPYQKAHVPIDFAALSKRLVQISDDVTKAFAFDPSIMERRFTV